MQDELEWSPLLVMDLQLQLIIKIHIVFGTFWCSYNYWNNSVFKLYWLFNWPCLPGILWVDDSNLMSFVWWLNFCICLSSQNSFFLRFFVNTTSFLRIGKCCNIVKKSQLCLWNSASEVKVPHTIIYNALENGHKKSVNFGIRKEKQKYLSYNIDNNALENGHKKSINLAIRKEKHEKWMKSV